FGPFLQNSRSRIDIASCKLPKQPDELSPRCILDQLGQNARLAASPQERANLGHSKRIRDLCDGFLYVRGRAVLEARLPYPWRCVRGLDRGDRLRCPDVQIRHDLEKLCLAQPIGAPCEKTRSQARGPTSGSPPASSKGTNCRISASVNERSPFAPPET